MRQPEHAAAKLSGGTFLMASELVTQASGSGRNAEESMRFVRRLTDGAATLSSEERTALVRSSASLRGVSQVRLSATLLGDQVPGLKASHIGHTFRAMVLNGRLTESETARAHVSLRVRNTRVASGWFCRIEADICERLIGSGSIADVDLTYWLQIALFKAASRHDVYDGLFATLEEIDQRWRGDNGDR